MKVRIFPLGLAIFLFSWLPVKAAEQNYVTPVFPVRAREYWRQGTDVKNFQKLVNLVAKYKLTGTWLLHYDVLDDDEVVKNLPQENTEKGLFLEVTRKLADDSFVVYDWEHGGWSQADKVFLSGYTREERQRLIDTAFNAFRDKFGGFPKAYGAWYIDIWSMEYIRDKYGADVVLGLADQYSTDGYQVWGQYFDTPYIVSKTSGLEPARDTADSTGILKLQWAPREPVLSYGKTPAYSNFSAQVNDYARGKDLGPEYFSGILDSLTVNVPGQIAQAVIGIEAGELEEKFFPQLEAQMKMLRDRQDRKQIINTTMSQFNNEYRKFYRSVSPAEIISSQKGGISRWWFMSPGYRVAISSDSGSLYLDDLRFYHQSNYRDDDQIVSDTRQNLVRMVPATIDTLVLDNRLLLGNSADASVKTGTGLLTINWQDGNLTATSGGISIPGYLKDRLQASGIGFTDSGTGLFVSPPPATPVSRALCHSDYGSFAGRFVCLKTAASKLTGLIPDLIFSKMDDQYYLGARTGFETFRGLRLPAFKLGRFEYQFPILDNFISLRKKLAPQYRWQGREELEILPYRGLGTVYDKGKMYGQEEISRPLTGKKIFENSYYAVIADN